MTDDHSGSVPATTRDQLPDHARRMDDLFNGIANIAHSIDEAGGVASGSPFIGVNNKGVWSFGPDRIEVEPESMWALDVRSLKHGYIAWPPNSSKERKPLGEKMVPASSKLPSLEELPDVGVPYTLQFGCEFLCISGTDAGTLAIYKNGSYGAKALIQSLIEDVRKQARQDPKRLCPVAKLAIRSYFHQEWKKDIHNPVLVIQKWITFEEYDGFEQVVSGGPPPDELSPELVDPEPTPEPVRMAARGTGRQAAPAPVPTPQRRPGRNQPAA